MQLDSIHNKRDVFNHDEPAGALHRPEIDGRTICFGEGEASVGPAAHDQVQRHHAHPVYGYRKVKTPGNQVLGILDTRPLSFLPQPGSLRLNMV